MFGDCVSANIVGYNNTDTESSGNTMVSPGFISVGTAEKTFKLSDLKLTGYSPDDGAWGEALLTVLNKNGSADKDDQGNIKKYYWYDNEEKTGEDIGWWDADGEVKWDAEKVVFDAGQAFWVYGEGYSLQSAGQVEQGTVSFDTNSSGNTPIGNPYPLAITLKDISFSGYNPDDGAWGEALLTVLNKNGSAAKDAQGRTMKYYWYDNEEKTGDDVGWWDADGEVKWDDATEFQAGQGFWVYGEGYTLDFTYPTAK